MATQEFLSHRLSRFHSASQTGLLGSIQLCCILQLNGASFPDFGVQQFSLVRELGHRRHISFVNSFGILTPESRPVGVSPIKLGNDELG